MFPLHSGHPGHEAALIVAMSVVVLAAAFALTREGWSRVGSLFGVAVLAGITRISVELVGIHTSSVLHQVGHSLELGTVILLALAGYYALFDVRTEAFVQN